MVDLSISNTAIYITFAVVVTLLIVFIAYMLYKVVRRTQQRTFEKISTNAKVGKVITQKKPAELDSPRQRYDPIFTKRSKISIGYWRDWWKNRRNPHTVILIHMELENGFHDIFLVTIRDQGFNYAGKKYLIDDANKYYMVAANMWAYDFHESITIPIRRKINVQEAKKIVKASGVSDMEMSLNPQVLNDFAKSKIAEGIMRGAQLDDVFRFLKMMMIVILVVTTVHALLFIFKSGILSQVSIPGVI